MVNKQKAIGRFLQRTRDFTETERMLFYVVVRPQDFLCETCLRTWRDLGTGASGNIGLSHSRTTGRVAWYTPPSLRGWCGTMWR